MVTRKNLLILFMLVFAVAPAVVFAKRLEGQSAKFTFSQTLFVAGDQIKPGDYSIQWESSSGDTVVTFTTNGKVAARVKGKVVEVEKKYESDLTLQEQDSSGRRSLKELQLRGKKIKIDFD